jgi:FAD/FMN-containing dehydrogenase
MWSKTTVLSPNCVFRPSNAEDVSAGLSVVRKYNSPFAVRSGGHMPVPGAASTYSGVLFAMTNINTKNLINDNKIAQIGPGQAWTGVYTWLSQYGLGVAGGRYAPVGVGGFLLGGGISFFGSEIGWGANTIVNYEVVLSDGQIINANATSSPDLFWALKGGSNNFGIVTRFDMKTFPLTEVFGGPSVFDAAQIPELIDATSHFVAPGGGAEDKAAAIVPVVTINPGQNSVQGTLEMFHRGSDPAPASLANFTKIAPLSSDVKVRATFGEYVQLSAAQGDRNSR